MDGHERLLDRYKVLRSRVSEVVISGMKVGTEHGFGVRRTCACLIVLASSYLARNLVWPAQILCRCGWWLKITMETR